MKAEVEFLYQSPASPDVFYGYEMLVMQPRMRNVSQSVSCQFPRDLSQVQKLFDVADISSLAGLVHAIGLGTEPSAVVELQGILRGSVGAEVE